MPVRSKPPPAARVETTLRSFLVVELEVEQELGDRVVLLGRLRGFAAVVSVWSTEELALGRRHLGGGLGLGRFARVRRRRGGFLPLPARGRRRRTPSRILPLRLLDGDGVDDGGVARPWAWKAGLGRPRRSTAWPSLATRSVTAPTVSSSPCFKTCCPVTFLPLTNVPLELPRSRIVSLSADLENLAMAPADLRRLDADQAVVVATDAGDAIGQLERRRGTSAADDLEYVIHRGFVPIAWHVDSHCCRRNDRSSCKLSSRELGTQMESRGRNLDRHRRFSEDGLQSRVAALY